MYCRYCGKVGSNAHCKYCGNSRGLVSFVQGELIEEEPFQVNLPKEEIKPPKNGCAIAGLVLSCLSFFVSFGWIFLAMGVAGLILSIMGLVKSKSMEKRGKKAAIAGIVLSAFVLADIFAMLIINPVQILMMWNRFRALITSKLFGHGYY